MIEGGPLDANELRTLFQEMSDRLAEAGVSAQLFAVGGAAALCWSPAWVRSAYRM